MSRSEEEFMLKVEKATRKISTLQMAKVGMLAAITIVMGLTNLGFIPLPMARATIMHIPVIIGAIVEGPLVGMLVGLIFGLFSLYQNASAPASILSPAFINPLVSVLPRVLIGVTAYYSYKVIAKHVNKYAGVVVGAIVGSLTNTVGVLTMIGVTYISQYAAARETTVRGAIRILYTIAYTNGIAEAIVAAIIVTPIAATLMGIKRRSKKQHMDNGK
jgi:uncharacterized membrane protein